MIEEMTSIAWKFNLRVVEIERLVMEGCTFVQLAAFD